MDIRNFILRYAILHSLGRPLARCYVFYISFFRGYRIPYETISPPRSLIISFASPECKSKLTFAIRVLLPIKTTIPKVQMSAPVFEQQAPVWLQGCLSSARWWAHFFVIYFTDTRSPPDRSPYVPDRIQDAVFYSGFRLDAVLELRLAVRPTISIVFVTLTKIPINRSLQTPSSSSKKSNCVMLIRMYGRYQWDSCICAAMVIRANDK